MTLREILENFQVPFCTNCRHNETPKCIEWGSRDMTYLCPGQVDDLINKIAQAGFGQMQPVPFPIREGLTINLAVTQFIPVQEVKP